MDQNELLHKTELLVQRSASHLVPGSRVELSPRQSDLTDLQTECDKVAEQVTELQSKLSKKEPTVLGKEDPTKMVLLERERMLIGYEKAYRESQPLVLPDDAAFQQTLLIDDLEKNIAELNDTLAWVKAQRQDINNNIDSESELIEERENIRERIRQRLDEVQADGTQRRPNESVLAELQKKETKVAKYSQRLMRYLRQFTQEHFPPPKAEDVTQWKRKRKLSADDDVLPLLDILEELMNRSVQAPNDPYILVNNKYWPPYLQLLVRVGIAQRHPEDDNRIKMTPFHL